MSMATRRVAPLLFGSGLCALIYQIAWTRELRLVFGASTAASAAVLAIFIGGLGVGGLVLGRRADRHLQPLLLYARLETLIACTAALTPLLLWLARRIYVGLGGSLALGSVGGTVLRLALAALVLGVPTFLMGGTLPAAARAVETDDDSARRNVALLYGVNTLGAVVGCLAATFFLLEINGTRRTLWIACLLNLLVAVMARSAARQLPAQTIGDDQPEGDQPLSKVGAPAWFVLVAAAVVGFGFFLMELVWYRMLGPLLGGTGFCFGLILAIALLGIGVGGGAYSLLGRNRPATLDGFALTCLGEAALIVLPWALGDRIAVLALLLRPLGVVGFHGHVAAWAAVTSLVVFPAALVAGWQFPLLIALLGAGRRNIGRQVGLAYMANTVGAIIGSLAGGFGLLPLLTAPGCWRLIALLLLGLGVVAILLGRSEARRGMRAIAVVVALVVVWMARATGPTAMWRHSQIGVGRVPPWVVSSVNHLRHFANTNRGGVLWEAEGVESSVALSNGLGNSIAFIVNGKIDGSARGDAGTQVMGGVVGALLLPQPRSALVIGLGTGSTAGWLGAIPGMERVDVVELEPAIREVARRCAAVNRNVLASPNVHLTLGDAREVLLTTHQRYDLIFSEPSNPYRAGIASLFTQEYYRAAAERLSDDGLFLQWVQAYEIDGHTVGSAYATLASVFPNIETWELAPDDILLVASKHPLHYDAATLRDRLAHEPYRAALAAWRVDDLEGFLSHFVARASLARAVAERDADQVNTDDLNLVEFGFARAMGQQNRFSIAELRNLAHARREDEPEVTGAVDWEQVEWDRIALGPAQCHPTAKVSYLSTAERQWQRTIDLWSAGSLREAMAAWRALDRQPSGRIEETLVAEGLAELGDEGALPHIARVRGWNMAEGEIFLARLRARQGHGVEAVDALVAAFGSIQSDPWTPNDTLLRGLTLAVDLASDPAQARRLLTAIIQPFSIYAANPQRLEAARAIALRLQPSDFALALAQSEPFVPWQVETLERRVDAYRALHDPRLAGAIDDLEELIAADGQPFSDGLIGGDRRP